MKNRGLILFDIDGVIRNVSNSYRLAVQKTVYEFCNWKPSAKEIDTLKNEGIWNNDWDLSLELIKRYFHANKINKKTPSRKDIVHIFEKLYFGTNPQENPINWTGYINNEEILVDKNLFSELSLNGVKWGFVSGAEPASAKFVLENKLELLNPPLIAMGDAPDKPNPKGLILLAQRLTDNALQQGAPPIAYLGDTIADIRTVLNAREKMPNQKFISIGVAPPHLHTKSLTKERRVYEANLKKEGADYLINSVNDIRTMYEQLFSD